MTKKVWCDDWNCPARVSCAHHFGRSLAYAKMAEGAKVESVENTFQYDRAGSKDPDACNAYKFDRPKKWLMSQPGHITHNARLWAEPNPHT